MNKNMILFIDKFGRTIMGEIAEENVSSYTIKNPGVIHIAQDAQTKRFNFQVLPLILFELLDVDATKFYNIKFNKEDISVLTTDNNQLVKVNQAFINQYDAMFTALANGLKQENNSEANINTLEVK